MSMFVVNATVADYSLTETDIRFYSNDTSEESAFVDYTHFLLIVLDVLYYALAYSIVISIIALYCVKFFFYCCPSRRDLL